MLPRKLLKGDKFAVLYDLWNQLIDHLQSSRPVPGAGIRIQRLPAGTIISAARSSGKSGSSVAVDTGDEGPFAVTVEPVDEEQENPEQVVRLHNTASESGVAGMLTIGSRRKQIADQEWPPKAGVVILDITYDDESEDYTVTFSLEETLPETKDEKRYILRIAEISYNNDTESWSAAQIRPVGDIEVLGRWVK